MKEIIFPAINLKLNINSVAVSIGGFNIYWYAIIILVAFLIGILLCKKDDGKYNIKFDENFLLLILLMIIISLISARLYYIIFYDIHYYLNNPLQIFNFRETGLAIYGGIIGGILTIIIYCRKKKINILDMLDYIAPFLALGQAIGRWGNFFNAEAHGTETTSFFRMGITENGQYMEVHPTFLYESISCLMIFIILYLIRNKRQYRGQITYLYLVLYGLVRAIIEGLRTDSLMIINFRVSQVLSIVMFIIFSIVLIYKKKKVRKNE